MQFFIDTADIDFVEEWVDFIDGVTTNPTLIAREVEKTKRGLKEIIRDLCGMIEGFVSVEVRAQDYEGMLQEAFVLAEIADNVCVKIPLTPDGLLVCKSLQENDIPVNTTLCFTPIQAILAAKAGATFISPFVGRLDDYNKKKGIPMPGPQLISDITHVLQLNDMSESLILASSIRSVDQIVACAKAGASVATIPPRIFEEMFTHPLTEEGLDIFEQDWIKSQQKIL